MNFWKWLEKKLMIEDDIIPNVSADAIICVGIDLSQDGYSASPYSYQVARKSLELFQNKNSQNIIITGGFRYKGLSEAAAMKDCIQKYIPANRIFLDELANRTHLNADESLKIMQEHGWTTAVVIAQQWHARRVKATFKKRWQGSGCKLVVVKAHSSYGGGSQRRLDHFWKFLLWDTAAFVFFKLKGYI